MLLPNQSKDPKYQGCFLTESYSWKIELNQHSILYCLNLRLIVLPQQRINNQIKNISAPKRTNRRTKKEFRILILSNSVKVQISLLPDPLKRSDGSLDLPKDLMIIWWKKKSLLTLKSIILDPEISSILWINIQRFPTLYKIYLIINQQNILLKLMVSLNVMLHVLIRVHVEHIIKIE